MRIAITLLPWLFVVHASLCFAETVSIKTPEANIRSGPGMKYDVLWSVGQFYPLQVLSRTGRWYQVKDFEGDVGWIHRKLISPIPTVVVRARSAKVRSGPGTRYRVRFIAERGSAFELIKKMGKWIRVRHMDGDGGWIHRKLLWGLED